MGGTFKWARGVTSESSGKPFDIKHGAHLPPHIVKREGRGM